MEGAPASHALDTKRRRVQPMNSHHQLPGHSQQQDVQHSTWAAGRPASAAADGALCSSHAVAPTSPGSSSDGEVPPIDVSKPMAIVKQEGQGDVAAWPGRQDGGGAGAGGAGHGAGKGGKGTLGQNAVAAGGGRAQADGSGAVKDEGGSGGGGTGKGGKGGMMPTAGTGPVGLGPPNSAVPAAASSGYMKPEVVRLPLEIGSRVATRWRDGQYHTAKIIERRPALEPPPGANLAETYDYYVHYIGYNRRMDEWVTQGHLDLSTVEVEIQDPDPKKRKKVLADDHDSDSDHGDFDPNALREHEEFTKVKNIEVIELGHHEMETWYFSPFPPEYKDCKKLYFCEYSLAFFKRRSQLLRHMAKLKVRHPPGEEIYRNGNVCMFEVDGKREKAWCQNLCWLAKLFLDHKTLYYDVDLFLFYVLCEIDERGAHVVGYFSKEKASEEGYNLACILMLPAYQRKGYGKALISMSYELSKLEGKVGTPERPLSDLGRVSYHGYWTRELLAILKDHEGTISIKELSERTAIRPDDIVQTLTQLGMVQYQKGQHVLCAAPHIIAQKLKQAGGPGLVIEPSKIVWTPYNAERDYDKYKP